MNPLPNVIIGGTNKAGTTSVFRYLSDHPEVGGSKVKETGFFVTGYSGTKEDDVRELGKFFLNFDQRQKIYVEASTSYLALGDIVIPRIKKVLGEPKMLFVLRNPIERIFSYYNFHSAQLSIPEDITFEKYLDLCLKYNNGELNLEEVPFNEWHLNALHYGKYNLFLNKYQNHFYSKNIKILFFDDLLSDPKLFMGEICEFVGVSRKFYDNYNFKKNNVTFSSNNKSVHRIALFLNRNLEVFLRQRPILKSKIVSIYKRINMAKQGYGEIAPGTKDFLRQYYNKSVQELEHQVGRALPSGWI